MKKIISLTLFLLFMLPTLVMAITDDQITAYAKQQYEAGVDQKTIAKDLLAKGATPDQIRRIQAKLQENEGKNATSKNANSRSRKNVDKTSTPDIEEFDEIPTDSLIVEEKPSPIFGHDLFSNKAVTFEPSMNLPTPKNYVLGPGDQVIIDIYGVSQSSQEYTISPDGVIVVENCGPISLSGLTIEKATSRIQAKVGALYAKSSINVSLGQSRSIQVMVMGEVKVPGSYTVSAFATVFHALYLAGGISDLGSMRDVRLFRDSKLISTIDVYDYILNGKMEGNVILQEGDAVVVSPYIGLVTLGGQVKRPMIYEMKQTETLADLFKFAGGLAPQAHTELVRVERTYGAKRSVYSVKEAEQGTFLMVDGDSVMVDGNRIDRYENMVEVKGAVVREGHYQIGEGQNTISKLVENAGGLDEQAIASNAVLYRMQENRTLKAIKVDVDAILSGAAPDAVLENEDQLYIPSKSQMLSEKKVAIYGEVYAPGIFDYADGETVEDLIVRAGGMRITASAISVEVTRRKFDTMASKPEEREVETFQLTVRDGVINCVGEPSGFVLAPFDVVSVRRSPVNKAVRSITIEGEATFAGQYALTDHNQRLSDIIKQAGGVTALAYVNNARLIRKRSKEEMEVLAATLKQIRSSSVDSTLDNRINVDSTYQIGIRLGIALKNPGGSEDIVLQDGDRLVVPELNAIVSIGGEVQIPSTVRFKEGQNYRHYIREAGGYTEKSRRRKAYVIYPNGVNDRARSAKIEPGCQIVVPAKIEKKRDFAQVAQITSITTSLVSVCAILMSLFK